LGIGPESGDAAQILKQTQAGIIKERSDIAGIKSELISYYQQWKKIEVKTTGNIHLYSRQYLTQKLINLLETV
jgi:hypothetical protein